ncbi:MAG: methylenetetrahydrofolate--tRNA-(uracil(54)-C(5))-methyltransferase (FADH(2)-oxidizing) TrmFO [Anaerolineae bacterium]|nr:methylenetetrahydrofolate--tRNA-(uracil(54)-C(5))-methyltransferase (FADH(2)-oxidizing) TrmFO [Anaerolineae bacterium]
MQPSESITIIGGGLAGCEAAWQVARHGIDVRLYEMRPIRQTPAHVSDRLAELVCSNSLGSDLIDRASGLLKEELRRAGSLIVALADAHRVPAGSALAVDRDEFSQAATEIIETASHIQVIRQEVTTTPETGLTIVASGPLTSEAFAESLRALTGSEALFFYDAIAPVVEVSSIDFSRAFRASRYGRGAESDGDYINCPMTQDEYEQFIRALLEAERIPLRDFERDDQRFFEACLPVEVLAARGNNALAFGPLRPVGLRDPRTGRRPYAVVQLRQDNAAGTLYNLVGFQTNLRYGEQARVLQMIPGLEKAEFVRYGAMHRNTYLNAPALLEPTLQFKKRPALLFAGQIAGLEGYAGNIAGGWLAGVNAARILANLPPVVPPPTTMIGALMRYISAADPATFQPMKANFGLLPPLEEALRGKRARGQARAERALADFASWLDALHLPESPALSQHADIAG